MRAVGLLGLILASWACGNEPEGGEPAPAPLIEFRLVHDAPAPGLDLAEYRGDTLYLDHRPLISDSDLRAVRPFVRDTQLLLDIRLTAEAAHRLFTFTGQHLGKRMALLLESQVRSAAVIHDAVGRGDGPLHAALDLDEAEANRLADAVRARWPLTQ